MRRTVICMVPGGVSSANGGVASTLGALDGITSKKKEERVLEQQQQVKQSREGRARLQQQQSGTVSSGERFKDPFENWRAIKEFRSRAKQATSGTGANLMTQGGGRNTGMDRLPTVDRKLYLKAEDAAEILGIKKIHVWEGSLKKEMVVDAFEARLKEAVAGNPFASDTRIQQLRDDFQIATEVLEEYLDSDVKFKVQGATIQSKVSNIAKEVQETLEEDRNWWQEAAGRFYLVTLGSISVIVCVFWTVAYQTRSEAVNAQFEKSTGHVKHAFFGTFNTDPPPNYENRYRDTPTSLDLHQKDNPDGLIATPKQLAAEKLVQEIDSNEDEFLTALFVDAEKRKTQGEVVTEAVLKKPRKFKEVSAEEKLMDMVTKQIPDPPSVKREKILVSELEQEKKVSL